MSASVNSTGVTLRKTTDPQGDLNNSLVLFKPALPKAAANTAGMQLAPSDNKVTRIPIDLVDEDSPALVREFDVELPKRDTGGIMPIQELDDLESRYVDYIRRLAKHFTSDGVREDIITALQRGAHVTAQRPSNFRRRIFGSHRQDEIGVREDIIATLPGGMLRTTRQTYNHRHTFFGKPIEDTVDTYHALTRMEAAAVLDTYLSAIMGNALRLQAAYPALHALEVLARHSAGMPAIMEVETYGLWGGRRRVPHTNQAFSWLHDLYQEFLSR